MPLATGVRFGSFDIEGALGAGGMGEVYRARDTRLGRAVALKLLPAAFAADAERVARFEREAQVLASLNHQNIAQIYGVEDGSIAGTAVRALVMELVEGTTLAERAGRGALPLDEALAMAKQTADALEAAHDKGIIHRDLKPANVMITSAGVVKVLDFGLAAVALTPTTNGADLTQSPTLTIAATQAGVILGTAAYMSPEQASGQPVDKRSDIWSFGVVVWEILTGRRLFDAETISHTLADVLRAELDFSLLPPRTPASIRELLRRCLDRDVRTRLRDIGEARITIQRALASPERDTPASAAPGCHWQRRWRSCIFASSRRSSNRSDFKCCHHLSPLSSIPSCSRLTVGSWPLPPRIKITGRCSTYVGSIRSMPV
jgi:serine/threonine-protein kinase